MKRVSFGCVSYASSNESYEKGRGVAGPCFSLM
jgi:hypothetical protein